MTVDYPFNFVSLHNYVYFGEGRMSVVILISEVKFLPIQAYLPLFQPTFILLSCSISRIYTKLTIISETLSQESESLAGSQRIKVATYLLYESDSSNARAGIDDLLPELLN